VCSSKKRQFPHSHSNPASRSNSSFLSRVCTCTLHRTDHGCSSRLGLLQSPRLNPTPTLNNTCPAVPVTAIRRRTSQIHSDSHQSSLSYSPTHPIQSNPIHSIPFLSSQSLRLRSYQGHPRASTSASLRFIVVHSAHPNPATSHQRPQPSGPSLEHSLKALTPQGQPRDHGGSLPRICSTITSRYRRNHTQAFPLIPQDQDHTATLHNPRLPPPILQPQQPLFDA
jgi:hypothetical protein